MEENDLNLGVSDTKLSNPPCSFCKLKKYNDTYIFFQSKYYLEVDCWKQWMLNAEIDRIIP